MTEFKRETNEFIDTLKAEFAAQQVNVPAPKFSELVEGLLYYADRFQRRALKDCNEGLTEAEEAEDKLDEERTRELCKPYGITPQFSGDPRGACLKILLPKTQRGNSFGDPRWYCVPTKEY